MRRATARGQHLGTASCSRGRRGAMKRLLRAVILAGLFLASATAQSDEKKAVDSLKVYVQHHLDSYQMNRRERVTKLGGGWVKQYFEMDVNSAEMDVQRTTSLISPYTARLDFRMILHLTAFHRSRDEAVEDTVFMQSDIYLHRHNYAYQDGKWVPKIRQHKWDIRNALVPMPWSDCTEVVMTGPDAGKTDMFGCLEEFDDV